MNSTCRHIGIFLSLIITLAPSPSISHTQSPFMGNSPPRTSQTWVGDTLRVIPSTTAGCNLTIQNGLTSQGRLLVRVRNNGSGARNITLNANLNGGGQNMSGSAYGRLAAGNMALMQVMTVSNASLTDSILTVQVTGCSPG